MVGTKGSYLGEGEPNGNGADSGNSDKDHVELPPNVGETNRHRGAVGNRVPEEGSVGKSGALAAKVYRRCQ